MSLDIHSARHTDTRRKMSSLNIGVYFLLLGFIIKSKFNTHPLLPFSFSSSQYKSVFDTELANYKDITGEGQENISKYECDRLEITPLQINFLEASPLSLSS